MDDVADILSGQYGIHQPGKLTPMAASKSSNSGIPFVPGDGVLAEKSLVSSSKKDSVLEILGLRLTKREGIRFDELVNGAPAPDDPFLVFEADFLSSNQFSGTANESSSAYVDGSDFFDISGGIGRSESSFPSERNGIIGRISTPGADQNPSNAQNSLRDYLIDLNPNSSAPKDPILANSDFFMMYETTTDEKETSVTASSDEKNKSYNGIEAFFSGIGLGGSRPPNQMEETSENIFDAPFETQGSLGGAKRVSTVSNFNINEPYLMKSSIEDLSFDIGAFQSHSKFQDIEGDNEHRRWARYEREKRKFERAAKALAEKNELDLDLQRERNEREMIAEELDIKVKQWAAGREGNIRALLSTLQDVLWPECGWQPISLSNLMTSTAVKKAYGKAALCIHPDKVQQKGSTLRHKYVAEKVFYLLTEALNKFNSKELT